VFGLSSRARIISSIKSEISNLRLLRARGKSEHHRAADRLTAGRSDPTTSATENRPADGLRAQVMGETVRRCWQFHCSEIANWLNVRAHQHRWRHSVARQTLRGARPNRETSTGLPARCALLANRRSSLTNDFCQISALQFPGRSLEPGSNPWPR